MKKVVFFVMTVAIMALLMKATINIKTYTEDKSYNLNEKIFTFLQNEENRKYIYSKAIKLNEGSSANTCVYFLAELLRENNFMVPSETKKVSEIIKILNKDGWEKHSNYEELESGDICFTTDVDGNKNGTPTHTYVFMQWVKDGDYDYAYICDNQAKDYNGRIYHVRNIRGVEKVNGSTKDAFAFFMKKS